MQSCQVGRLCTGEGEERGDADVVSTPLRSSNSREPSAGIGGDSIEIHEGGGKEPQVEMEGGERDGRDAEHDHHSEWVSPAA